MKNKIIPILIMIVVLIPIIIADLISKHFIIGIDQELIPGVIKFFYTQNTGAAWSMLAGSQIALISISCVAIVAIVVYIFLTKSKSKILYVALGFILGGAIGNLVDRLAFGYVRDFIKLEFMTFPVFNIADMALTVGVILLCIYLIISGVKESRKNGK